MCLHNTLELARTRAKRIAAETDCLEWALTSRMLTTAVEARIGFIDLVDAGLEGSTVLANVVRQHAADRRALVESKAPASRDASGPLPSWERAI